MKIFIHYTESKRLFRINISSNSSFLSLKKHILRIANKKQIKIHDSIRIRHVDTYIKSDKCLKNKLKNNKIQNNDVFYISSSKLRGGDGELGLYTILEAAPIWAIFVSICCISLLCPLVYIMLLYGGVKTPQDVYNMVYDTTSLSKYNNYNIRKSYDEPAYIDLVNQKYYILKYIKDCNFTIFKSTLYLIFFILYAIFVVFTSNIFFITLFLNKYSLSNTKCFIHTNIHPIHSLGISICIVLPIILFFIGMGSYKLSILTYIIALIVGNICILTSIYWNSTQNMSDALKYMDTDPAVGLTPDSYTSDVNYMPNYFRYLYWTPIIVILLSIFCHSMHIHPLIWGVLVGYIGSLPSYYVLQNEIPLYCNNAWFYKKNYTNVLDTITKNNFTNLMQTDKTTNKVYHEIFK